MPRAIWFFLPIGLFLAVQWYGVYFLWYHHPGPLGINDGVTYIDNIAFYRYNLLRGYGYRDPDQIVFSLFYGAIARVFSFSPVQMFQYNFYIGLLMMAGVLSRFLKRIDPSFWFLCIAFLFFAFYEGNGVYHGFFWVVPSFYAVMLFLIAVEALFYSRHRYLYGVPVMALLMVTHSLGIYLDMVLVVVFIAREFLMHGLRRGLSSAGVFLSVPIVMFLVVELLHITGITDVSLFTVYNSHHGSVANSKVLDLVKTYAFAKYFYGVYTPLVAYGLYSALKNRQDVLLLLFSVLFAGQIATASFTDVGLRFFYPLEIVVIVLIAYGLATLLRDISDKARIGSMPVLTMTLRVLLATLSLLFLYDLIHLKAAHNYSFKHYNPRYFDEESFLQYMKESRGCQFVFFTLHSGLYTTLDGLWGNPDIHFSGAGITGYDVEKVLVSPGRHVIVGENHRYFDTLRKGFQAVLPHGASLSVSVEALPKGRYRLELVDTGLENRHRPILEYGKTRIAKWKESPHAVMIPELGTYPPILLPWYWHADTPWPLFLKRHNDNNIRRHTTTYSAIVDIDGREPVVRLTNEGSDLEMSGQVRLIELSTGRIMELDLDWGAAEEVNRIARLDFGGKSFPLLWSGAYPGMLLRLERNFRDVKAFSVYSMGFLPAISSNRRNKE